MKRSTQIFIITVVVIYGGILLAVFVLPRFGIRVLPALRSRSTGQPPSSVNKIKIPEYYKDLKTAPSPQPDSAAAKMEKHISCATTLGADSIRALIRGQNFFCRSSRWSGKWANPSGTGVRTTGSFLHISDSTIIDTLLRTIWKRHPHPDMIPFNLTDSLIGQLNAVRWQGYDDWRLPTIEELMSLVIPVKNSTGTYLPDDWPGISQDLWSCNPVDDQNEQDHQWIVRPVKGRCNFGDRKKARSLLAVRDW